jgi:FlaA1/EpsC-like NDP-sugar epimerase
MTEEKILITGGSGSWGNELVSQIIDKPEVSEIRIYSRGEHKQIEMKRKFYDKLDKLRFIICDVRDQDHL